MEAGVADQEPPSLSDFFWSVLPYHMSIGMTWDLFWHGEPRAAKAYREADMLRAKRLNAEQWQQGLYHMHAVGTAVSNCLRDPKKNPSPVKYLEEPFPLTQEDRARAELKRLKAMEAQLVQSLLGSKIHKQ